MTIRELREVLDVVRTNHDDHALVIEWDAGEFETPSALMSCWLMEAIDRGEEAAAAVIKILGSLAAVTGATVRPGILRLEADAFGPIAEPVHEFA